MQMRYFSYSNSNSAFSPVIKTHYVTATSYEVRFCFVRNIIEKHQRVSTENSNEPKGLVDQHCASVMLISSQAIMKSEDEETNFFCKLN